LHALLGELPLISGSIRVSGRISYATQEPWIFAGTVKQNILFNEHLNVERYNQVLKVSQCFDCILTEFSHFHK